MMRIKIAERLKPFSHVPGEPCLLPGTFFRCCIFPALIKIDSLAHAQPEPFAILPLDVEGPLKDFTVLQDLERGIVQVWGHSAKGYFRYRLIPHQTGTHPGIWLQIEKAPTEGLQVNHLQCCAGDQVLITQMGTEKKVGSIPPLSVCNERLSLGNHKAQDWTLIRRRLNLGEIMPIWFRLGNQIALPDRPVPQGTMVLLEKCRQLILEKDRLHVLQAFRDLFLAGFEGMLSPRLTDADYQGYHLPPLEASFEASPLVLIREGAELIRSLFIQEQEMQTAILPVLPVEFHCGRMMGIEIKDLGSINLEWSKKTIRRMVLNSRCEMEYTFVFKEAHSFRLRSSFQDAGERILCGKPLAFEKDKVYFFDNFMH